ncbi:hypothetical protein VMT65_12045 [Nocardia sp. CDC153]|uniref:DUF7373 family lipoprotein n=1 Tax=Nocardia sp. CDC153 TaxID=3112167 RepID=UPI002DB5BF45|nr:hypothetical protein [Nocardia sp. CDC153]MEC3953763.1 hypothetical protein [Nocardia sp. CDC153]
MRKLLSLGVPALVIAALLTGCTTDGKPVAHKPDTAALDTGRYSVDPLEPPVGTETTGHVLESARLAEAMLDPTEVDAALTHAPDASTIAPVPTPARAATVLADSVRSVLERHGMLAGCMVAGSDVVAGSHGVEVGKGRVLVALVLRFPDTAAAQQAATEIDTVDAALNPENVAVTVPGYPAAHSHWRPSVPTMAATLAQDDYVISLLIGHTSPDLAALTGLARKAFDAQTPLLRNFTPTPANRLAALPLDPDHMVRLMVPDAPDRWMYPGVVSISEHRAADWGTALSATGFSYGPRATMLFRGRKDGEVGSPPEAMVTNGFNAVFRYPDVVTAHQRIKKVQAADAADTTLRPTDPPAGVSDVSCYQNLTPDKVGMSNFICKIQFGRYTAIVMARDATGVRQRAAAQYGLLVNGG